MNCLSQHFPSLLGQTMMKNRFLKKLSFPISLQKGQQRFSSCNSNSKESLDFIPLNFWQRLKNQSREIDPSSLTSRQIELSQEERTIGEKLRLLENPSTGTGFFSPNEWIQLLTHPNYWKGSLPNQRKWMILGEKFGQQQLSRELLGKALERQMKQQESSNSIELLTALNSFSHLTSHKHIAIRMRILGITPLMRLHLQAAKARSIPDDSYSAKTFWALVGGIYHKRGEEMARNWMFDVLKVTKSCGEKRFEEMEE